MALPEDVRNNQHIAVYKLLNQFATKSTIDQCKEVWVRGPHPNDQSAIFDGSIIVQLATYYGEWVKVK